MKLITVVLFSVLWLLGGRGYAQDTTATEVETFDAEGALEGINETMAEMKTTLDALKKIKVSGYLQAQFQSAEGWGPVSGSDPSVGNFSGGNFPANSASRYSVRRGRVKVNYDNDLTQYVLQIDVTQGGVGIKDAYISIKEPWMRTFALTAGVFDRPFGFEISYSSSNRESPERSRLFQTLFPGERELGAKIEITPETGPLSYFNLKAGLFNGVLPNANENDRNKDFIGRLGVQLPFDEQNLAVDAGLSGYVGKVTNTSKFVFETDESTPAHHYNIDSTSSNLGKSYDRNYIGGDVQLYYDVPVLGGLSLRGEYITGTQPGTASSNVFYNPGATVAPLYTRNFTGWYVFYLQNIAAKHQFVARYDVLDPNTDVTGDQIGSVGGATGHTLGDIKFSTLGIGWLYHWDANVKFTLYYEIVENEKLNAATTGSLAPFTSDVKDDVLTLRMQYKF